MVGFLPHSSPVSPGMRWGNTLLRDKPTGDVPLGSHGLACTGSVPQNPRGAIFQPQKWSETSFPTQGQQQEVGFDLVNHPP